MLEKFNSAGLYLVASAIILFIVAFSLVFLFKSYRAGIEIGMDKKKLKKSMTVSATFTVLPSISILLGVVALSGTLGIPLPWIRLSVVGALHYETTVADIASRSLGLSGLNILEMTPTAYATIALIMSVGIIWGVVLCLFGLKKYLGMISKKNKVKAEAGVDDEAVVETAEGKKKMGFGDIMMKALFIGLISAYLGSYLGTYIGRFTFDGDYLPLVTVVIAGVVMAIFEFCQKKFKLPWLDNFSLAASMLIAMTGSVLVGMIV